MNDKDKKAMQEAADHLMRGLAPRTKDSYRRILGKWNRFMAAGKRPLRTYDVEGAREWYRWLTEKTSCDVSQFRTAVFPLRCVEVVQQVTDRVSDAFAIPYALWNGKQITYRDNTIPEKEIRKIIQTCASEIDGITTLTADAVVTFAVYLATHTGLNAESLTQLKRDCLVPQDPGCRLFWYKGRSGGTQSAYFDYKTKEWGVCELVNRLKALGKDSEYLMVATDKKTRPLVLSGELLASWCRKRGLRRFTLSEIRPAMASIIFAESGGSVTEVQRFLQHKHPSTTVLYLEETVVRPIIEQKLSNAIDGIYERIIGGAS